MESDIPYGRRLRCVIIGAGVSGLLMAHKLQEHLKDYVSFQVFEKSSDLGGTWQENTYPGCACDVPSHCYQYSFATNPDWSQFYASSQEIKSYLRRFARRFDLARFIHFNTKVTRAEWSDQSSTWIVITDNGSTTECEVLINAGGILNELQMPKIPGLDTFSGPLLHTAAWDSNVDLTRKRVAVIGSGASAVQLVPRLEAVAQSVHVFIRTPSYISSPFTLSDGDELNHTYSEAEKAAFREGNSSYLQIRKDLEKQFNGMFGAFFKDSPEQAMMQDRFTSRMSAIIEDEKLRKRLIPSFQAGCRRNNPGEEFLRALQKPNVRPVFDAIDNIRPSYVTAGGTEYEIDVLACATGFNTSFVPRFPIIGKQGIDLREEWRKDPISYMGLAVSGFPNYVTFLGPNTPISNGSLMGPIEAMADYFVRIIRKMIRERVKSFNVRPGPQRDFDLYTRRRMEDMVWTGPCSSWFKQGPNGKITALWPGSSLHYMQVLAECRWEDFEWVYERNRYDYWQQGFSWIEKPALDPLGVEGREHFMTSNVIPRKESDLSFYLQDNEPLPPETADGWPEIKSSAPGEDSVMDGDAGIMTILDGKAAFGNRVSTEVLTVVL